MVEKESFISIKKRLWKEPISKLMNRINELEKAKWKMESVLRLGFHSNVRYSYGNLKNRGYGDEVNGSMKSIKRQIASIKTIMHERLSRGKKK